MLGSSAASLLSPWRLTRLGQTVDRLLYQRAKSDQLAKVTRLPISAFVRHFQIGQELTLEGCKHLNERHMDFDRSELCLGKTPGRFLESTLFCVFDLGQTDKPSLRRQQ